MGNIRRVEKFANDDKGRLEIVDTNERNEQESQKRERPELLIGAEAALRRAAIKARKRAIENTGSVAVWKDGKIVYETEV